MSKVTPESQAISQSPAPYPTAQSAPTGSTPTTASGQTPTSIWTLTITTTNPLSLSSETEPTPQPFNLTKQATSKQAQQSTRAPARRFNQPPAFILLQAALLFLLAAQQKFSLIQPATSASELQTLQAILAPQKFWKWEERMEVLHYDLRFQAPIKLR